MRDLVAVATKHGATAEIADRIGDVLRDNPFDVTVAAADQAVDLEAFEAVILGSSAYAGRWMTEARDLAERIASGEASPLVWLFSSGPVGDPPKPEEDPADVAGIHASLTAQDHQVFAGKLDKSKLSFGERAIVSALRAPEGDFRDWNQISTWANDIARTLRARADDG